SVNFFHWWDFNVGAAILAAWRAWVHSFVAPVPFFSAVILSNVAALALVGFLLWESWEYFQRKKPLDYPLGALWVWVLVLSLFLLFYLPGALRFRLLLLPPVIYL